MSLIIQNITAGSLDINDLGESLAASATLDLSRVSDPQIVVISASSGGDLNSLVTGGQLAVKDPIGGANLSVSDALVCLQAFNDSNWRHGAGARIGDNSDVDPTGITNGQALIYNSGTYTPGDIAEGVDRLQAYYVNKHGSDTNTGLRPDQAFLTFGAAVTAVNGQSPTTSNRFAIICDDGGIYNESFTVPSWTQVNAESAKIGGTVTLSDDSEIRIREIEAAVNNSAVQKTAGSGSSRIIAEKLVSTGTGDTVSNGAAVTGILICMARQIFVENGTAVIDNSTTSPGHVHVEAEDIYITGTGSGVDSNTANGFVVGQASHILEIGGGAGFGTAFTVSTGRIDMLIGYTDTTTAYNVSGNGRLRIIVNELGGTRIQTAGGAVVDVLEANSLRWITIDNTDSPYVPRRIEFLNVDTTAGPVHIDLDNDASDGDVIWFQDAQGTFGTNNLQIDANGNTIAGVAVLTISINNQSGFAVFQAATSNWSVTFNAEAAFSPDNVIYVTKNGSDTTGDGSFSNPFLTVKKGAQEAEIRASASNPTTVKILDGIYDEVNPIPLNGTDSRYITLQGSQEQSVIIRPTVNGQPLMNMSSAVATDGPTLSRMTLQGQNNGGTDYKDVANSDLIYISGDGVFFTDKVITLAGNRAYDIGNGTISTEQEVVMSFATSAGNVVSIDAKGANTKFVGQAVFISGNDTAVLADTGARVELGNFEIAGNGSTSIGVDNNGSATVFLNSGYIRDNLTAIEGNGTSTTTGASVFFENNTTDLHQVTATAIMQIQGFLSKTKQSITDGSLISLNYIDTDTADFIVGSRENNSTPGLEFRVRDFDGRVFIGDNAENYNAPTNTVGGSRTVNLIDTNGNFRVWRWQATPGLHPAFEWVKGVNTFIADDEGDAPITAITAATDTITIDVSGTDYNDPLVDTPQGSDRTTMAQRVFYAGAEFRVNGTVSNNGDYVVVSSVYNSGPQTIDVVVTTDITVDEAAVGTAVFGGGAGRPDGVSTYVGDPSAAIAAGVGDVHWDMLLRETDSFVIRRRTGGAGKEHVRVFPDRTEFQHGTAYDGSDNNLVLVVEGTGGDDYFTITNDGSGNPDIEAVGVDANINISLTPKGTGTVIVPAGYEANITDNSLITKAYIDGTMGELPVVQVRRSTTLAVPTTWGDITFDTTDVENDATVIEHNNTNTDNIDIKEDGLYGIAFHASIDADAGEETLEMRARVNDTTVIPGSLRTISEDDEINDIGNVFYYEFTAGDFVTFQQQASGAGNVLNPNSTFSVWRMRGAQGPEGPPGTGATIAVEDEGASLGTSFTTLDFVGEGVTATDAGGGTATITIPYKNTFFHGHNGTTTQTFTTTPITVNFATNVRQDSDYTAATVVGGTEVTINRGGTNWYKITYDLGVNETDDESRAVSMAELQVNTVAVAGSDVYAYHRYSTYGEANMSKTVVIQLAQNDVVRVRVVRHNGSDTLTTIADTCTLTIQHVDAP